MSSGEKICDRNDVSFEQLLSVVGKTGLIDLILSDNSFDIDQRLLEVVGHIQTTDDEYIPSVLVSKIKDLLERYDEKMDKDSFILALVLQQ